jgi:hypothetical protein
VADRLKKPAAKATNDDVYEDDELFLDDTAEDDAKKDMEYYRVNSTGRWGHSLSSGGPPRPDTSGMSAVKHRRQLRCGGFSAKHTQTRCKGSTGHYLVRMPPQKLNTLVW